MKRIHWLVILLLVGGVLAQHQAWAASDRRTSEVFALLEPRLRGEAWVGQPLPEGIADLRPEEGSLSLVWFLDLDDCVACDFDLANWVAMTSREGIEVHVMFASADAEPDHPTLAALKRAHSVRAVPHSFAFETFGINTPSLRFVANAEGLVIDVDHRIPNSQCRWSYAAQIGRLSSSGIDLPFIPLQGDAIQSSVQ